MRCRAARPVLRKRDDTHIQRPTTLRSRPLVPLAVQHQWLVFPARHAASSALVGIRQASRVSSPHPLVAAVRLSLVGRHRLASPTSARASSLSGAHLFAPELRKLLAHSNKQASHFSVP